MYLPDGTASLASVRPGHSIRAMLAGICEKRGFSLPDIKVYLVGNEQVGQAGGAGFLPAKPSLCWHRLPLCWLSPDGFSLAESVGAGPGVLRAGGPGGEAGEQD